MKIFFVSLGCDKNRVDTEVMLAMLQNLGHDFTDDEDEAEAAVVNTCCFIGDAKQESIDVILALAERRKSGQLKALIVTGCLAQRYKEEIQTEIPEVDEMNQGQLRILTDEEKNALLSENEEVAATEEPSENE